MDFYKSSSYIDDGIRLVQISNVWEDSVKWDDITCVPNEDAMSHPLFILKPGDIVMALTRPIIKSLGTVKIARIRECDTPCVLNQRVCKYDFSDSHVSPNWFYHFARTKYFKDSKTMHETILKGFDAVKEVITNKLKEDNGIFKLEG